MHIYASGLFTRREADIVVGPGNAYVAKAKRLLFGRVGIDVFTGPTESAIIADETADPMTVAIDLASQAAHGTSSPVWLFATSQRVGEETLKLVLKVAEDMPNSDVVNTTWSDWGEIIYCAVVDVSDRYALEHLQVLAEALDWWKNNLNNYGSLFLGEGSTVSHGDKRSGTNHILPTKQAGRHSGGLNVHKLMRTLTYQQLSEQANRSFRAVASRISRASLRLAAAQRFSR